MIDSKVLEDMLFRDVERIYEPPRKNSYKVEAGPTFEKLLYNGRTELISGAKFISRSGLVLGQSDYCIVTDKNGQQYIANANGFRVSDYWKHISEEGLIQGTSEYYLAESNDGRQALFHSSGLRISNFFKHIDAQHLLAGESDMYIATKDTNFKVVFSIDGRRITKYHRDIYAEGLIKGLTNYYIAKTHDNKMVMLNTDGHVIGKWDVIHKEGLPSGESMFYLAEDIGNNNIMLFHDRQMIGCWKRNKQSKEFFLGVLKGKSSYYMIKTISTDGIPRYSIFNIDGHREVDWFYMIKPDGLVSGESEYFIFSPSIISDKEYIKSVYDSKSFYSDFRIVSHYGLIKGQSNYGLSVDKYGRYVIFDNAGNYVSHRSTFISYEGLVNGKSPYYITYDNKDNMIRYYHVKEGLMYEATAKEITGKDAITWEDFQDLQRLANNFSHLDKFIIKATKDKYVTLDFFGNIVVPPSELQVATNFDVAVAI